MSKKTSSKVATKVATKSKKVKKPDKYAVRAAKAKPGHLIGVINRMGRTTAFVMDGKEVRVMDHLEIKTPERVYSCENVTGQPFDFLREHGARKGKRIGLTIGSLDENLLTIKSIDWM